MKTQHIATAWFFAMLLLAGCSAGTDDSAAKQDRIKATQTKQTQVQIDSLTKKLEGMPDKSCTSLYLQRGELFLSLNEYLPAIEDLDHFLAREPKDVKGLLARAEANLGAERFKDAISDATLAIAAQPENDMAHYIRAKIHAKLSDHEAAVADLHLAIEHRPNNVDYFAFRAAQHLELNQLDLAREDVDRALEIEPSHLSALLHSGAIQVRQEQFQAAIATYGEAIRFHPSAEEAYLRQGECQILLGDLDKAIQCANDLLKLQPRNMRAVWLRGACYERLEDWPNAYKDFAAYEMFHPDGEQLQAVMNKLRDYLSVDERIDLSHEMEKAMLVDFDQQVDRNEGKVEPLLNRADMLFRMKRLNKSLDDINAAIQIEPIHMKARKMRVVIYQKLKRFEQVVVDCDVILRKTPDDMDIINFAGAAHFQLGNYNMAIKFGERSVSGKPNALNYFLVAAAKFMLADPSALENLKKANDLNGRFEEVLLEWQLAERHEFLDLVRAVIAEPNDSGKHLALAKRKYEKAIGYQLPLSLRLGRGRSGGAKTDREFLLQSAIESLNKAVSHDFGSVPARLLRSRCHHELKQYSDEPYDLEFISRKEPTPANYISLAEAYHNLHKLSPTIKAYQNAIDLMPENEERSKIEKLVEGYSRELKELRAAIGIKRGPVYDEEYFRRQEAEQREMDRFDRNFRRRHGRF